MRAATPQPPAPARYYMPAPPRVELKPIPAWAWIGSGILIVAIIAGAVATFRFVRALSKESDAAVAALHHKMTVADDAGIFAAADPSYQQSVTPEASSGQFDNVRLRLGAPHASRLLSSSSAEVPPMGTLLTNRYSTVFDKDTGRETVCLHQDHGVWKLAAYSVDSPALRANRPAHVVKPSATP